jgi:hypothetical protein
MRAFSGKGVGKKHFARITSQILLVHTPCIFFRYDDRFRAVAVVLFRWCVELDKGGEAVRGVIAAAGKAELGEAKLTPQQTNDET